MNLRTVTRGVGVLGTLLCIGIFVREPSFPTPDKLVIFATFVFMIFGQAWPMLKKLLPFVALLLVYEAFRGVVPYLNNNVHYRFMVDVDRLLWFGQLPTITLQQWFWHGHVHWYDFVFYLTYMMHFVIPIILVLVVWKVRAKQYWRCAATYLVVSFAGFMTFLAFPAAPPWMASDLNIVPHITRVSSDVWYALGIQDFPSVYNKISPNPVAAVPSLHAAYSTIFALLIFSLFKRSKWKYLSLVYPAIIYVGTVYSGEHYLFDEVTGALYGVGAFVFAPVIVRNFRHFYFQISKLLKRRRISTPNLALDE